MNLSKKNLQDITSQNIIKPSDKIFALPEKVLQFGTGALLRGLPDYFIDNANRKGIFNGRIVVVKSTDAGDIETFHDQDNLYTLCIRGIESGKKVEENIICSAISRVLSANKQWDKILECARNGDIQIVISNTTEVGIKLIEETIFKKVPVSFPAKLLAVLYERYKFFNGAKSAGMLIIPTELITDNGKKLRSIIIELAQYNNLEKSFIQWLSIHNNFCNSLVDCIVPGKPNEQLVSEIGYTDDLLIVSEVYRLWAIEGNDEILNIISFAAGENRIVVATNITKFKELKLRLLNATHTLSCGLAFLAGINTVNQAMNNKVLKGYLTGLMLKEIAPSIPCTLEEQEANSFGFKILERFQNPYIHHQWLSITTQYSSKMFMRTIPLLHKYFELFKKVPEYYSLGFAAYLLFMKPVKKEDGIYFGILDNKDYVIIDECAGYYFTIWQNSSIENIVKTILKNESYWKYDLTKLAGFEESVFHNLKSLISLGGMITLENFMLRR